jgi:phosphocarrier protein
MVASTAAAAFSSAAREHSHPPQGVVTMPSRTVKVASRVGLHARPASLFVQAVTATGLPVTISKSGGDPVDARSILMVMGLAVGNNEEVTLTAEGDGADAALDQLVELLEIDHDAA